MGKCRDFSSVAGELLPAILTLITLFSAGESFLDKVCCCTPAARAAFWGAIVQLHLNAEKSLCQLANLLDLILAQFLDLLDQTYQFTSTHSVSPHLSLMVPLNEKVKVR